jgi:hypothetical protein
MDFWFPQLLDSIREANLLLLMLLAIISVVGVWRFGVTAVKAGVLMSCFYGLASD